MAGQLSNVTVPGGLRAPGFSGHIEALNKWLGVEVGNKIILHYMANEPYYVPPFCTACHSPTSRIVYVTVRRLLQNDYIVPMGKDIAHFYLCFLCDKPAMLYLHPAVAGVKVDASPVACSILPLTQSPAWV